MNSDLDSELDRLIDALIDGDGLDGDFSEADWLRLEAAMIVDPTVRKRYYDGLCLDEALRMEAHAESTQPSSPTQAPLNWRRFAGVALAIAASLLMLFLADSKNPNSPTEAEREDRLEIVSEKPLLRRAAGFGLVRGEIDAVWSTPNIEEGSLLPDGMLSLQSGLACIELFSGVELTVAGRSDFHIDSPMQMTVHRGQVRLRVPPPAIGFRVETDRGTVIDHGTEFVVDADRDAALVSVVEGKVELVDGRNRPEMLVTGEAMTVGDDEARRTPMNHSELMIGPADYQSLRSEQTDRRRRQYQQACDALDRQPQTLVDYRFDTADGRRTANAAGESGSDAIAVATAEAADRWGRAGRAVDLSPIGSRVRLRIDGTLSSLSMFCWVKVDSLDRDYNSLFLTDGHDAGEPHWQWLADGRLFFSVKPNGPGGRAMHIFHSPPVWSLKTAGRWTMLGVVYDAVANECRHYVNGSQVSTEVIAKRDRVPQISIGAASIGNWNEPAYRTDPSFVIRNLNGSIDQFVLRSDAMTDEQMMDWYRTGLPSQPIPSRSASSQSTSSRSLHSQSPEHATDGF